MAIFAENRLKMWDLDELLFYLLPFSRFWYIFPKVEASPVGENTWRLERT